MQERNERRYTIIVDDVDGPGQAATNMTYREAANYAAALTRNHTEHTPEKVVKVRTKFLAVFENGFEVVREAAEVALKSA